MAGLNGYHRQVNTLRKQIRVQIDALEGLAEAFASEAENLSRHDQAQDLRSLKTEVMQEVTSLKRMESAASYEFTKRKLVGGVGKFFVWSLLGALSGSQEDPISTGIRWSKDDFAATAPFDTVMVGVGASGIPDEVNVMPVSQWARELGRSEAEIEAVLQANGHLLFTPHAFEAVMDELEDSVLKGIPTLPVTRDALLQKRDAEVAKDRARAELRTQNPDTP